MSKTIVTAPQAPGGERKLEVEFNFGETLSNKIELFGDAICNSKLEQKLQIDVQAFLRGKLNAVNEDGNAKYSDEEIVAALLKWKPGEVTRTKRSASDKALALFEDSDPDEQDAILKKIVTARKLKKEQAESTVLG